MGHLTPAIKEKTMDHKRKRHAKRGRPKIKENNWERRARQLREGMAKWMPNPWMDPRGGRKEKMI
jgi:hypothetical protein